MRVLVVDDEAPARRRLVRMLDRLPGIDVAGQAADGVEALERIAADRPDTVLLDIRMPGMDGLAVAAASDDLPPIIFTTAYDEHAVQAFELSAADYLLKPIIAERLREALHKVERRSGGRGDERLQALLERLQAPERRRLAARSGDTIRFFDPREVARIRASEKYTLFERDGIEYVLDESLSVLEARLADLEFVRVHRAELVNLKHVRALHGGGRDMWLELADGQKAAVSRRAAPEVRRRLGVE